MRLVFILDRAASALPSSGMMRLADRSQAVFVLGGLFRRRPATVQGHPICEISCLLKLSKLSSNSPLKTGLLSSRVRNFESPRDLVEQHIALVPVIEAAAEGGKRVCQGAGAA